MERLRAIIILNADSTVWLIFHLYFQKMPDRNLKNKVPAWQDDMIIVTTGSEGHHPKEIEEILKNLQEKAYKTSFEKSRFFEQEIDWC